MATPDLVIDLTAPTGPRRRSPPETWPKPSRGSSGSALTDTCSSTAGHGSLAPWSRPALSGAKGQARHQADDTRHDEDPADEREVDDAERQMHREREDESDGDEADAGANLHDATP